MSIARVIAATLGMTFSGAVGCGDCSEVSLDIKLEDAAFSNWATLTIAPVNDHQNFDFPQGWDEESVCVALCVGAYGLSPLEWTEGYDYVLNGACQHLIEEDGSGWVTCDLTMSYVECRRSEGTVDGLGGGGGGCDGPTLPSPQGRRPLHWRTELCGRELDKAAVFEQVSITAFEELAVQLEHHGAPPELVSASRRAARDEARHVELIVSLGAARPTQAPTPASAATTLVEIARHNATEGCVLETWAAMLASYQARQASSAAAREVYAEIAADETGHAQLAWDLHAWLLRRLDPETAVELEQARARALRELPRRVLEQMLAIDPEERRALGLPDPRQAARMARDFAQRLAGAHQALRVSTRA